MAVENIISQIGQFSPVQTAMSTAEALRNAQVARALQQAQTGLAQTRTQLLPQQIESQIRLAQINAQGLAEQRKANLGLNELRTEIMLQKLRQQANAPTPGQEALQKADAKALGSALPDMSAGSDISERVLADLNEMKKNYANLGYGEKGVLFGHTPAVTNAAQAFDRALKDLVINLTGQMKNIRSTDSLRKLILQSKVGRNFGEGAFNEGINSLSASAKRVINKSKYFSDVAGKGISGFGAASRGWNEYISHYPLVDPQTGEILQNNVGKAEQFSTPEAIQKLNNGQYVLSLGENPQTIPSIHGIQKIAPSISKTPLLTTKQNQIEQMIEQTAKKHGLDVDEYKNELRRRGLIK